MIGTADRLAAQTEIADQRAIPLQVLPLEVVEEAPAAAHQHQEAAAGVVVVLVLAQVVGEVVDATREHRDLDLRRTRVLLVLPEAGGELRLLFGGQRHARRGTVAGPPTAATTRSRP